MSYPFFLLGRQSHVWPTVLLGSWAPTFLIGCIPTTSSGSPLIEALRFFIIIQYWMRAWLHIEGMVTIFVEWIYLKSRGMKERCNLDSSCSESRGMMSNREGSSLFTAIKEWLVAILLAFLIALFIRLFLFAPYEVHGTSMSPTLNGEELLVVNKWIYNIKEPEYGDIIVFHTSETKDFIKRIIGLPGDRIKIENGILYRNGKPLHETYIKGRMEGTFEEVLVPSGHLFVLGDNRNNSKDSRVIGTIRMQDVVGRAEMVLLPISEIHFFLD